MISAKFTLCWMSESGIRLNMRFIFLEIPEQWYFTHMRFFIIKKKLEVPFTQALYQVWLMLARWYESLMCANNIETDWLGQTDQPKRLTDKTKVKIALFGTTHQCSDLWVFYISDEEGNHAINHSFPKKYKTKNICLKTNFSKKNLFNFRLSAIKAL